jgi:hypothetical protein
VATPTADVDVMPKSRSHMRWSRTPFTLHQWPFLSIHQSLGCRWSPSQVLSATHSIFLLYLPGLRVHGTSPQSSGSLVLVGLERNVYCSLRSNDQ